MSDNLVYIFDILTAVGWLALVVATFISAKQRNSAKAITVTLLVLFLIADIHFSSNFDGLGIYLFRIMSDFALVLLLHIRTCRETAIIMMLSLCSILINIVGFSYEIEHGRQELTDIVVNFSLMGVFYFMLAVLLSKGLSNGIYGLINRISPVRHYCQDYLKIDHKRASK